MMTLLEQAFAKVQALPPNARDEIARTMLALAHAAVDGPEMVDPDHLADVTGGLEEVRRRAFASDADIAAAFARFAP